MLGIVAMELACCQFECFSEAEPGDTHAALNTEANQNAYAHGSLIKTDSLYNLCYPVT
jgi:hypothetical protein